MTSVMLAGIVQVSLVAGGAPYAAAHRVAMETGRPIVVLVGADWCPYCVRMQRDAIPVLKRRGVLQKVAYAHVDADREPQLARQIMNGGALPQMVMYTPTAAGWRRTEVIGGQSAEQAETFINRGLKSAVAKPPAARRPEQCDKVRREGVGQVSSNALRRFTQRRRSSARDIHAEDRAVTAGQLREVVLKKLVQPGRRRQGQPAIGQPL